jgi:hypothetical protein
VAFVLFSALFITFLWSRSLALCSPCYDLGIFAQTYDNMSETLLPTTTCERGEHLSHFAVHFSPVPVAVPLWVYTTSCPVRQSVSMPERVNTVGSSPASAKLITGRREIIKQTVKSKHKLRFIGRSSQSFYYSSLIIHFFSSSVNRFLTKS